MYAHVISLAVEGVIGGAFRMWQGKELVISWSISHVRALGQQEGGKMVSSLTSDETGGTGVK